MHSDDRQKLLQQVQSHEPETRLLFSKVLDQASLCEKNHQQTFTGFMDPLSAHRFLSILQGAKGLSLSIIMDCYGGYEDAERLMLGFAPEYAHLAHEDFPMGIVEITYDSRFAKELTHRDILGAVLGLGIERSRVGDILMGESMAQVVASADMGAYIAATLEKAGRSKVSAQYKPLSALVYQKPAENERTVTVSSLRIDALLAHAFNLSRSKAVEWIDADKVLVNWQPVTNAARAVAAGDVITLRGKGRVRIAEIAGRSKKEKWIVKIFV